MKFREILNKDIRLSHIKMKRGAPIDGNEKMPIDHYNFAMCIYGPSGSGKTSILLNLLRRGGMLWRKFDLIHVYSPSLHTSSVDLCLPPDQIHESLDVEDLSKLIEDLRIQKKEGGDCETLLVFDDVLSEIQEAPMKVFQKLVLNRAHAGISIIFTSQSYLRGLPPILRKNLDYVLQINTKNQNDLNAILSEHSSLKKDDYYDLLRFCFQHPHDFILFKNDGSVYRNFNRVLIE